MFLTGETSQVLHWGEESTFFSIFGPNDGISWNNKVLLNVFVMCDMTAYPALILMTNTWKCLRVLERQSVSQCVCVCVCVS